MNLTRANAEYNNRLTESNNRLTKSYKTPFSSCMEICAHRSPASAVLHGAVMS